MQLSARKTVVGRRPYGVERPARSLAQVKSISLASPDGTLKCQQVNGQRCTAEQAKALYEIGRAINLTVSFSGSESK